MYVHYFVICIIINIYRICSAMMPRTILHVLSNALRHRKFSLRFDQSYLLMKYLIATKYRVRRGPREGGQVLQNKVRGWSLLEEKQQK